MFKQWKRRIKISDFERSPFIEKKKERKGDRRGRSREESRGKCFNAHYGPEQKKNRRNRHLIIHFPTSLEVSELVSERAKE